MSLVSHYPSGWLTHRVATGLHKQQKLKLQDLLRPRLVNYMSHRFYYIQCVKERYKVNPRFKEWKTTLPLLVRATVKFCGHFAHSNTRHSGMYAHTTFAEMRKTEGRTGSFQVPQDEGDSTTVRLRTVSEL